MSGFQRKKGRPAGGGLVGTPRSIRFEPNTEARLQKYYPNLTLSIIVRALLAEHLSRLDSSMPDTQLPKELLDAAQDAVKTELNPQETQDG